jgi:hypothetical protein
MFTCILILTGTITVCFSVFHDATFQQFTGLAKTSS